MRRYTLFLAMLGLVASVFATTVSGIFQAGEYAEIDGIRFYVDDIEFGSHNAVISIRDSEDNLLSVGEVQEGKSVAMSAAGREYVVLVNKTAQGLNFISKWAELVITPGPALLNVGELEEFDGVQVRLDDIERDTRNAAITLLYEGSEVSREEVKEGGYVIREVGGQRYKVSVTQTSMGSNFVSKWAKISAEPTAQAESANGYPALRVGEVMEEGSLRVRLDDIERDTSAALISILDGEGNVLSQDEIPVGKYVIRAAEDGQRYQIRSYATMPGYNFIAKWAKFSATPTTLAETRNYPTISAGETLSEGSAQVTLEDIERDTSAALLIVSDGENTSRVRVLPGRYVVKTLGGQSYEIKVYQTAPGLNFIAKWAKLTIEPTTRAEPTTFEGTSVISIGEALESPDGNIRVRLDDIERDTNYALISVLDSGDNIIWQEELKAGGYTIVSSGGSNYLIRSYEAAPGLNFIAKWARLKITDTSLAPSSVPGNVVNAGETVDCAGGQYRVRLDDIERDRNSAIISILDSDDEVVLQDKVSYNQQRSYVLDGSACTVKTTRTAPGLNFIAKWARLQTN